MSRACPRDMPRLPPWQTAAQPPRSPKKVDMSRSLSGCSEFQDEHQRTNSCACVPYHLLDFVVIDSRLSVYNYMDEHVAQADSILETSHSQKPSLQSLRVQRSWTSTATRRTKRKGCTKGPSELPLPWLSSGLRTEQPRRESERTDRHLQRTSEWQNGSASSARNSETNSMGSDKCPKSFTASKSWCREGSSSCGLVASRNRRFDQSR